MYTYGTVAETKTGAVSNYNGVTFSLRKQFSKWVAGHINYTWSHNIDENSNGGIFTYGDSVLGQISPISLRTSNYGNSDYDIRHLVNGDFVFNPSFHESGANEVGSQRLAILRQDVLAHRTAVCDYRWKPQWLLSSTVAIRHSPRSLAMFNRAVAAEAMRITLGNAAPCLNSGGLLDTFNNLSVRLLPNPAA